MCGLFSHCREWELLSGCGVQASRRGGFSWCGAAAPGLASAGSAVAAHRLSCSVAGGIFLDQGSNPCPLRCTGSISHGPTREVPRPPDLLFQKLGAERGSSKQLQPGFLPWRLRPGRRKEPGQEQGWAPTWLDRKGAGHRPHGHSPGGSPPPWRKQEGFLHGRKGSFLLRTELGELGSVPTALPSPPSQCRVTVTLGQSPGRRQAWWC